MRIDVGGYKIEVQAYKQKKSRRSVVLLHGLAGTGKDWDPILPVFAPDHDVYTVDLIGHGASDAPTDPDLYTFDALSNALVKLADGLGLQRPIWMGYSLGARLALNFALKHPERVGGLVLESVHPGFDSHHAHAQRMRQDREDAEIVRREGLDVFFERWHRRPVFDTRRKHTQRWAMEVEKKRATNKPEPLANCLQGLGVGAQDYLIEKAQMIDAPTLLVAGLLDPTYVGFARDLRERIPNSRLELVHYAGHGVHIEDADAFRNAIRRFLDEFEGDGDGGSPAPPAPAKPAHAQPGKQPSVRSTAAPAAKKKK